MTNVPVPCYSCHGKGTIDVHTPYAGDPLAYQVRSCDTCKGFGFLVATELKAVETWVAPCASSVYKPDFRYLWPRS